MLYMVVVLVWWYTRFVWYGGGGGMTLFLLSALLVWYGVVVSIHRQFPHKCVFITSTRKQIHSQIVRLYGPHLIFTSCPFYILKEFKEINL